MNYLSLVQTTTDAVALPGILDPFNLIGWFGTWAFVGLLLVIFIESGVLFPVLPGDSLLFVAGLIAAGSASAEHAQQVADANFNIWLLIITIPIAAILGGQVGYWIGRFIGVEMFKPDARFLKQRYLDEAHEFFEKNGPITIFLARFVPIVRTLAPIVAGSAKMSFSKFTAYNVLGAIVWGAGITLLGYWLGQFEIVQKLIEPIFILIVLLSILPMFIEWYRRRRVAGNAALDDPAA
ncbi:MAG TPA: VTT domain-containing protein [Gordonia sp. (in: high G+C Gram-positive bacteria)]|uniref:VTT domain-containing protein n=1 Tax=Gordonia sp. (in: high G+C Gram-positive bacteria) TaxID=84139 RepID=UPI000F9E135E|nr:MULTISPECIES: VTT domain-containing protein [unclassified Gordonia (in: high G+C Gram-positive bacteria)]RUP41193.1 MAG: DedA family protein [Gordonia sp. (in: high G+C Gram-positive bacteria)]HNP55615.1 VTT domain-containing protein [Gordonia sp. (in: high G+C Gram-positive bacteria)]HRC50516.1 VTT domain-containing protein [Gordonia sp. (in: high G+C Gram-positive bacteria)]